MRYIFLKNVDKGIFINVDKINSVEWNSDDETHGSIVVTDSATINYVNTQPSVIMQMIARSYDLLSGNASYISYCEKDKAVDCLDIWDLEENTDEK